MARAFSTNALALAAKMKARASAVRREIIRELPVIQVRLHETSRSILASEVYGTPIPVGKNGKPLWERRLILYRAERAVIRGLDITLENDAAYRGRHYAPARNDLGLPGHRQPVYTKSVQWQLRTLKLQRKWIQGRYQAALQRALKNP